MHADVHSVCLCFRRKLGVSGSTMAMTGCVDPIGL